MIKRFIFIIAMLVLGSTLTLAQDTDVQGDIELFGNTNATVSYVYTITESDVIDFVELPETEQYEIHLGNIPINTEIIQLSPPGFIEYASFTLYSAWEEALILGAESEDPFAVRVEAEINLGESGVLFAIIDDVSLQDEELFLTIEVVSYIPDMASISSYSQKDAAVAEATLPDKIEAGTLADITVSISDAFWANFIEAEAVVVQSGDMRAVSQGEGTDEDCALARNDAATLEDPIQAGIAREWYNANCR